MPRIPVWLAVVTACSSSPPARAPQPAPPPPPPAVPIPTERVELAPEPTISLYAYTTLMTLDSERRTYHLQRTGQRIVLDVITEVTTTAHLHPPEVTKAEWNTVVTERFAGSLDESMASAKMVLDRTSVTGQYDRMLPQRLEFTCTWADLPAYEVGAAPYALWKSTEKTGCLGSKAEWRPSTQTTLRTWRCGPARAHMFNNVQLAFHADSGIEWVGEWVDCHTQTEAYRRRAPTKL